MSYTSPFSYAIQAMAEEIGKKVLPAFVELVKYSAVPIELAEPFQQTTEAYQAALTPNTPMFGLQVEQMWAGIVKQFIEEDITPGAYQMGAVLYLQAVLTTKVLLKKTAAQSTLVEEDTEEYQRAISAVGWYSFVEEMLQRVSLGDPGLKPAAAMVERYFRARRSATRL